MTPLFADSGYWIALLDPRDPLHHKAVAVAQREKNRRTVTSEMVLVEVFNTLGKDKASLRNAAMDLLASLQKDANVDVVPQTSDLFRRAAARYAQFTDKAWGLTDCASMVIMMERGIRDVLTHDHHFEQAGFYALLREE